jgi:hypothetical protein
LEYLVTGKDLKQQTVQNPLEAKMVAEITAQMKEKNRKKRYIEIRGKTMPSI